MLTISKPLSAGQARHYHADEFRNARENYYTQGEEFAASGTVRWRANGASQVRSAKRTFSGSRRAIIRSPMRRSCATRPPTSRPTRKASR